MCKAARPAAMAPDMRSPLSRLWNGLGFLVDCQGELFSDPNEDNEDR